MKVDRNGVEEDPDIAGIVPGPQPLPYDLPSEEDEQARSRRASAFLAGQHLHPSGPT